MWTKQTNGDDEVRWRGMGWYCPLEHQTTNPPPKPTAEMAWYIMTDTLGMNETTGQTNGDEDGRNVYENAAVFS